MMVELARELKAERLVHLGKIARITGLSENYLAQLAIPLKSEGLLVGVSGKKGGYHLSRGPEKIRLSEIIRAVIGPIEFTECVNNPDLCLNSSSCEARMIWVILSGTIMDIMDKFTLADLIDQARVENIRDGYSHLPLLFPDRVMAGMENENMLPGCPMKPNGDSAEE